MKEWFEQETFWRELYPYIFNPQRFAEAEPEVRALLRLVRRRHGTVLDLCCGPGRHAVALARRGFTVTGVDRTAFLLRKARQLARQAGVQAEFVQADMRQFVRPGAFDLALSLYTSFGYFAHKNEDRRVLQQIFRSLKPGGALVMDLLAKERVAKVFVPATVAEFDDGALLVQRQHLAEDCTRLRHEWILVRGQRARRFRFEHTLYSGQELRDRLQEAGFARVRLCGGFGGEEYGLHTPRLVVVARKDARP